MLTIETLVTTAVCLLVTAAQAQDPRRATSTGEPRDPGKNNQPLRPSTKLAAPLCVARPEGLSSWPVRPASQATGHWHGPPVPQLTTTSGENTNLLAQPYRCLATPPCGWPDSPWENRVAGPPPTGEHSSGHWERCSTPPSTPTGGEIADLPMGTRVPDPDPTPNPHPNPNANQGLTPALTPTLTNPNPNFNPDLIPT